MRPLFRRGGPGKPLTEEALWPDLLKRVGPFKGYKLALAKLEVEAAPGYALAFAFNYVDADISNGGISQLNSNPTWTLLLKAIEAVHVASCPDVERLLRQVLLYYHERGRSRFKKLITDDLFAGLDRPLGMSLSELDDAYYALEAARRSVIPNLLSRPELWRPRSLN